MSLWITMSLDFFSSSMVCLRDRFWDQSYFLYTCRPLGTLFMDTVSLSIVMLMLCTQTPEYWVHDFLCNGPDVKKMFLVIVSQYMAKQTQPWSPSTAVEHIWVFDHHNIKLVQSCFYHLWNSFKKIQSFLTLNTETILDDFVSSCLEYCISLFTCLNQKSIDWLLTLQNSAARLLTRAKRRNHITPVLASLYRHTVFFRIDFKILLIAFKALHGLSPWYISNLLLPVHTLKTSGRHLFLIYSRVPSEN